MSRITNEDDLPQAPEAAATNRRVFLGKSAAMAAAAVGAPALLAACGADATAPAEASGTAALPGGGPSMNTGCATHVSPQPWFAVHHTVAGTIGANAYVKVPSLEQGKYGYVQRVITNDSRIGTALSTVMRKSYKWERGSLSLVVQDSWGKTWPARSIGSQGDLAYAMKDALAGNTLGEGVLRESLNKGHPVVAVVKSSVVQYVDSVASDYYGNRLKPSHCAFSGIFNSAVSDIAITTTIRDFSRC